MGMSPGDQFIVAGRLTRWLMWVAVIGIHSATPISRLRVAASEETLIKEDFIEDALYKTSRTGDAKHPPTAPFHLINVTPIYDTVKKQAEETDGQENGYYDRGSHSIFP